MSFVEHAKIDQTTLFHHTISLFNSRHNIRLQVAYQFAVVNIKEFLSLVALGANVLFGYQLNG